MWDGGGVVALIDMLKSPRTRLDAYGNQPLYTTSSRHINNIIQKMTAPIFSQ
jgi:hypothetical protein